MTTALFNGRERRQFYLNVGIRMNNDFTHTAYYYGHQYTGTLNECKDWLNRQEPKKRVEV